MKDMAKQKKKFEDESMAIEPLDSMSQSLPVYEVQVNFLTLRSILLKLKVADFIISDC